MNLSYARATSVLACLVLLGCPGDDTGASTTDPTTTDPSTTTDDTTTIGAESTETGTSTGADSSTGADESTGTSTGTSTGSDSSTDTGGLVEGCECIVDEDVVDEPAVPQAPTCGEMLCPPVTGGCLSDCGLGAYMLDDPAALQCALQALRDRTPGVLHWTFFEYSGQYEDDGYFLILEDGRAVRRRWGWEDLIYEAGDAELGELRPSATYDACLLEPDDFARFDCMRRRPESPQTVCDEGWTYFKL